MSRTLPPRWPRRRCACARRGASSCSPGPGSPPRAACPRSADRAVCGGSYRPEDLATPEAFARDPRLVWEWYAWRREIIAPLAAQRRPSRPGRAGGADAGVPAGHAERRRPARGGGQPAPGRAARHASGGCAARRCAYAARRPQRAAGRGAAPLRLRGAAPPGRRLVRRGAVRGGGGRRPSRRRGRPRSSSWSARRRSSIPRPRFRRWRAAAGAFVIEVNPEADSARRPLADVSLRGTAASLVPALVEGA